MDKIFTEKKISTGAGQLRDAVRVHEMHIGDDKFIIVKQTLDIYGQPLTEEIETSTDLDIESFVAEWEYFQQMKNFV